MTPQDVSQACLYILNNTQEVLPYILTHKEYLAAIHPKMNMMKVLQEHNRTFVNWFKETILADDRTSKTLRLWVIGPNLNVPLGRDMILTTILCTQGPKMIKVPCRTVG